MIAEAPSPEPENFMEGGPSTAACHTELAIVVQGVDVVECQPSACEASDDWAPSPGPEDSAPSPGPEDWAPSLGPEDSAPSPGTSHDAAVAVPRINTGFV